MFTCPFLDRTDVRLIDIELMTFPWFVPMLGNTFSGVIFPGKTSVYRADSTGFLIKDFLDANINRFHIFVYESLKEEVGHPSMLLCVWVVCLNSNSNTLPRIQVGKRTTNYGSTALLWPLNQGICRFNRKPGSILR